jgi:hypothetical protein
VHHQLLEKGVCLPAPAGLSGEGGNDLNGNKRQMKDQELKSGNQALLVNLALGLPVRLLRKNEGDSATGVLYYFDGLYDVVRWLAIEQHPTQGSALGS